MPGNQAISSAAVGSGLPSGQDGPIEGRFALLPLFELALGDTEGSGQLGITGCGQRKRKRLPNTIQGKHGWVGFWLCWHVIQIASNVGLQYTHAKGQDAVITLAPLPPLTALGVYDG